MRYPAARRASPSGTPAWARTKRAPAETHVHRPVPASSGELSSRLLLFRELFHEPFEFSRQPPHLGDRHTVEQLLPRLVAFARHSHSHTRERFAVFTARNMQLVNQD